jgi:hypothetical protein
MQGIEHRHEGWRITAISSKVLYTRGQEKVWGKTRLSATIRRAKVRRELYVGHFCAF